MIYQKMIVRFDVVNISESNFPLPHLNISPFLQNKWINGAIVPTGKTGFVFI